MHQKRLSVNVFYPMKKKVKERFVVSPRPGPHRKEESIPLLSLLRDVLGYCDSAKEARHIVKSGKVMVDGKVRKDHKYPVGIFDVIEIPEIKRSFRMVPGKKWLGLVEIDDQDLKLCKIKDKRIIKGGRLQLSLHDGKTLITKRGEYATGDSVLISLPKLEIKKHIKRDKDSMCLLTKGNNRGKIGRLKGIRKTHGSKPNLASVEVDQKKVDVPEDFVFIIGDKDPAIKMSD
ncbi:MAG: 30S ribosomal protein S4e [archaeon]|nr:MAG: 30S ribosomal protein S4e [archaeon]